MTALPLPAVGRSGRQPCLERTTVSLRHIHNRRPIPLDERPERIGQHRQQNGRLPALGRVFFTYVAFPANHLVTVVLHGEGLERRLDEPAAQPQDEMERGFLLDVVVGEGAPVLELLAGEDEALLVRRDALLVLDLGFYIVNRVRRLHLEGDGLARQGLDEAEIR